MCLYLHVKEGRDLLQLTAHASTLCCCIRPRFGVPNTNIKRARPVQSPPNVDTVTINTLPCLEGVEHSTLRGDGDASMAPRETL